MSFAQSSPPLDTPVPPRGDSCDPAVVRACAAAATELEAARKLIIAQASEIDATQTRLEAEKGRVQVLIEQAGMLEGQIQALQAALAAQKEASAAWSQLSQTQQSQIASLQKSLLTTKKRVWMAVVGGVVLGIITRF